MPALNARRTITKAVSSLIAQSCQAWELLIIADDEIDYSSVLRKGDLHDKRIHFLRSPAVGSGVSTALNIGRQAAHGLVVTRLDADDWYEPERLATLSPLAIRNGVAGDNVIVFDDLKKRKIGPWLRTSRSIINLDPFNMMISPIPFLLVFRRDILPKWDEDLIFAEDVVCHARAFEHLAAIPVVSECLWNYRIHSRSLSSSVAVSDVADTVYSKLLTECETNRSRLRNPRLQRIFRNALMQKRLLNREFGVACSHDQTISFQEFVLERRGSHCDC